MEAFSWAYVASGFGVGLLVGITGVGGGSLMTPLLTLLFGFKPSVAVGTDIVFAAITKAFGTAAHRQHGHVRWHIVAWLSLGSLPAAIFTIVCLHYFGAVSDAHIKLIKWAIAFSVLLTALSLLLRQRMLAWLQRHPRFQLQGRAQIIATVSVGVVIGALVTVSSIGAGAVGATLILLLYPHLQAREVAGTDIAYAVPLTAVAGIGHIWLGTVNWALLVALLMGSIPGIALGAQFSRWLPEKIARSILATILSVVAVKLVA